jgi:hypothetical protein
VLVKWLCKGCVCAHCPGAAAWAVNTVVPIVRAINTCVACLVRKTVGMVCVCACVCVCASLSSGRAARAVNTVVTIVRAISTHGVCLIKKTLEMVCAQCKGAAKAGNTVRAVVTAITTQGVPRREAVEVVCACWNGCSGGVCPSKGLSEQCVYLCLCVLSQCTVFGK